MNREKWLADTAEQLQAVALQNEKRLTLDQIGEAIGDANVSADDIEALFARLEAAGVTIGEGDELDLAGLLRRVIQTALALKKDGQRPSPQNIAQKSGMSSRAVKVALLYSDVLRG